MPLPLRLLMLTYWSPIPSVHRIEDICLRIYPHKNAYSSRNRRDCGWYYIFKGSTQGNSKRAACSLRERTVSNLLLISYRRTLITNLLGVWFKGILTHLPMHFLQTTLWIMTTSIPRVVHQALLAFLAHPNFIVKLHCWVCRNPREYGRSLPCQISRLLISE